MPLRSADHRSRDAPGQGARAGTPGTAGSSRRLLAGRQAPVGRGAPSPAAPASQIPRRLAAGSDGGSGGTALSTAAAASGFEEGQVEALAERLPIIASVIVVVVACRVAMNPLDRVGPHQRPRAAGGCVATVSSAGARSGGRGCRPAAPRAAPGVPETGDVAQPEVRGLDVDRHAGDALLPEGPLALGGQVVEGDVVGLRRRRRGNRRIVRDEEAAWRRGHCPGSPMRCDSGMSGVKHAGGSRGAHADRVPPAAIHRDAGSAIAGEQRQGLRRGSGVARAAEPPR